jgi:hypothetical protein
MPGHQNPSPDPRPGPSKTAPGVRGGYGARCYACQPQVILIFAEFRKPKRRSLLGTLHGPRAAFSYLAT